MISFRNVYRIAIIFSNGKFIHGVFERIDFNYDAIRANNLVEIQGGYIYELGTCESTN